MGYLVKGWPGVTTVTVEPSYDAATGIRSIVVTYQGHRDAILDFEAEVQAAGLNYDIQQNGPVMSLTARYAAYDPTVTEPTRFEISTESAELSIWQHPTVLAVTHAYDTAHANSTPARKMIEDFAEGNVIAASLPFSLPIPSNADIAVMNMVVRYLRAGVTGFQIDLLVLRRYRRIETVFSAAGGRMNLDGGSFIYTTAQLGLPSYVGFTLPATPSAPTADYQWGWRKRSQRLDIIGQWTEQAVELLFAPHGLLFYSSASGNLAW